MIDGNLEEWNLSSIVVEKEKQLIRKFIERVMCNRTELTELWERIDRMALRDIGVSRKRG